MKTNKGFTIFFAVLVSSLALAIGLSIYDLIIRELALSQTATQSQFAINAADTGAECALYWDAKYNCHDDGTGTTVCNSAFPESNTPLIPTPTAGIMCNGQDIAAHGNGTPPNPYVTPTTGWNQWQITAPSQTKATTVFTLDLTTATSTTCVTVTVDKVEATAGDPAQTTVTAQGYNNCNSQLNRLERALQISY